MKKIFVFWIIFLIILTAGIILAISSRSTLKREEKRAEQLRKAIISRPSRLPKQPVVSEGKTEGPGLEKVRVETPPQTASKVPKQITETAPTEPAPATPSSPSGEIPPLGSNIPVQINTNSLEITVPSPASQENPVKQEEPQSPNPAPAPAEEPPAAGQ